MRSTLLPSVGLHLGTGTLDHLGLTKAAVEELLSGQEEEEEEEEEEEDASCQFIHHSLPNLISSIQHAHDDEHSQSGPVLRNKNRPHTRTFPLSCQHPPAGKPGGGGQQPPSPQQQEQTTTTPIFGGEGQLGGLLGSFGGTLTSPVSCKQMGGEGIPVRSKSLFGHANKNMGKMDPAVSNGSSKQPREADEVRSVVTAAAAAGGLGGLLGGLPLPSPEPCAAPHPEGKRRNLRKAGPGHGHGVVQTSCVRQILLLQLELIEQQQQQLQCKNNEIDALKEEKEMLMTRIDRMEKALQHTTSSKKRNSRNNNNNNSGSSTETQAPPAQTTPTSTRRKEPEPPAETREELVAGPKPLYFGRGGKGQKRSFVCQEPRTPGRARRTTTTTTTTAAAPPPAPLARSPPQKLVIYKEEEETEDEDEDDHDEEEEEEESMEHESFSIPSSSPSSLESEVVGQRQQQQEQGQGQGQEPPVPALPYLATTDMYLCCWQPSPDATLSWREPSPSQDDNVELPSWRENTVAPLSKEEMASVTESVEDAAYRKRHLKQETDEKRRKRWDIQRIREQRILMRLQQRMEKKKGPVPEPEPQLMSFYPEADEVESIMVTPYLPVVAFGRPLPSIKPQNFELPWLYERERVRSRTEVPEKKKKKTPHRTCRK